METQAVPKTAETQPTKGTAMRNMMIRGMVIILATYTALAMAAGNLKKKNSDDRGLEAVTVAILTALGVVVALLIVAAITKVVTGKIPIIENAG